MLLLKILNTLLSRNSTSVQDTKYFKKKLYINTKYKIL